MSIMEFYFRTMCHSFRNIILELVYIIIERHFLIISFCFISSQLHVSEENWGL